MNARSALVTGGSGFIGRELTKRLVREGWSVACVGRRDPGVDGARFIQVANLAGGELAPALQGLRADAVFHLAAYGVAPHDRDPQQAFDANVAGTATVVRAAASAGAEMVVYAGSCSEYADAEDGVPIPETHPLNVRGLYGASKAAGGLWGAALARQLGMGFAHMRLFGVYGPGEAAHRLLPSIMARLSRGEPADLSPGDQVRDLMQVDDAVEGLLRAKCGLHGAVGTFNLCSGRPIRIKDAALAIADALGAKRELLRFGAIPVRSDETMWLVGDNSAFARATGFAPRIPLQAGIARTIASVRARRRLEDPA